MNSGLMIMQYTAASLVSENKVLAHPASVDSIPTGANAEDHVSMSTHAARKMRTILGNVQSVIAIELIVAAQAIEWRVAMMRGVPEAHTLADAETQATGIRSRRLRTRRRNRPIPRHRNRRSSTSASAN